MLYRLRLPAADLRMIAVTCAAGAAGAGLGWVLSFPVYLLTGPAAVATALGLAGVRLGLPDGLRGAAFVVIGTGIGAGVDPRATAALLTWPVAFAVLAAMLVGLMAVSQQMLWRVFGFSRRDAVLAAAPGHLSYVLSIGAATGSDVARIAVVQSIRLLALTFLVPLAALALGIEVTGTILPPGATMGPGQTAALLLAGLAAGGILHRLGVPAPLLLGALATSTLAHLTDLTPGTLAPWLAVPGFAILGTLIGSRFAGVPLGVLRRAVGAGAAVTVLAVGVSALAALAVAAIIGMPPAHLLIAFAPGGFETMIAIGAVLGASPGFVAACHVARLLILSVLVPWMLPRDPASA